MKMLDNRRMLNRMNILIQNSLLSELQDEN